MNHYNVFSTIGKIHHRKTDRWTRMKMRWERESERT